MAYVYCRKCDWSQDDCWSESYNPFQLLLHWQKDLLTKDLDAPLDGHFDKYMLEENGLVGKTWRDFFIHETEKAARKVRNIQWKTEKEFKDDPYKFCPSCGCQDQFVWD